MKLEFAGYDIYTDLDGEAGLNMARSLKPDLILLDVMTFLQKIKGKIKNQHAGWRRRLYYETIRFYRAYW